MGLRVGAGLAARTPVLNGMATFDVIVDEYQGLLPSLGWHGLGQVFRLTAGVRWVTGAPLLATGFVLRYAPLYRKVAGCSRFLKPPLN